MLDYIRNPFASKRLSAVVGKSKFLTKNYEYIKNVGCAITLRLDKLFKLTTWIEEC